MDSTLLEMPLSLSRSKRIKKATSASHDRLDQKIMRHDPFTDVGRYCQFLKLQHHFHSCLKPVYQDMAADPRLTAFRCTFRLQMIEQDLADLGSSPDSSAAALVEPLDLQNLPRALGWLYVAEGSNLGAAFLLKAAARLGLSQDYGARHLAAPEEGRGLHWHNFTTALDALDLEPAQEDHLIAGAREAFESVHGLVEFFLGQH